jgi:hypothetical protein
MDNTVFKVATAEGELTNISKCVAEDDGFHINGSGSKICNIPLL